MTTPSNVPYVVDTALSKPTLSSTKQKKPQATISKLNKPVLKKVRV